MKKPGILDGVTVALLIALGAGAVSLLLGGFIVYGLLFEVILYAATLTYLLYLLKRSNARVGRVLAIVAWAMVSIGGWLFDLFARYDWVWIVSVVLAMTAGLISLLISETRPRISAPAPA